MGQGKTSENVKKKYQAYSASARRIKNKTRKLEKRIAKLNPTAQEQIRKHCPIGRKGEK